MSSSSTATTAQWQSHNNAPIPQDISTEGSSFKITAPPNTDIWRRSDESDVFTAPAIYQSLPARTFTSLSVTVFAPWKTQYDQGGLIIAFPSANTNEPVKWIKAGIEYHDLECVLGVVGTDRYSDWSISPMSKEYHQKARFVAKREGTTLWVYAAQEGTSGGKLLPVREVKWAFLEGRIDREVWVGVYAAKPTAEEGSEEDAEKGIEVTFSDLKVERE